MSNICKSLSKYHHLQNSMICDSIKERKRFLGFLAFVNKDSAVCKSIYIIEETSTDIFSVTFATLLKT